VDRALLHVSADRGRTTTPLTVRDPSDCSRARRDATYPTTGVVDLMVERLIDRFLRRLGATELQAELAHVR